MEVVIRRQPDDGKQTLGDWTIFETSDGDSKKVVFSCKTLELPDKLNQHSISCIPKGEYECEKVVATAAIPYPHIWIKNVPNRDGIKVHRVNYVRQLRGCVGVGEKHIDIDGDGLKDVTNSTHTLDKIMAIVPDKFKLTIK